MTAKNFKLTGDFFERVPRTTAEQIQSYLKAIGCLDGHSADLVHKSLGVKCNLAMDFRSHGPAGEAPGHPGYGTWPWSYGLYRNDLANPASTLEDRQELFRFPDHYAEFDNWYTDPNNAGLAVTEFQEVFGSEATGTYSVGAQSDNLQASSWLNAICPVITRAGGDYDMNNVLARVSENASIVEAVMAIRITGLVNIYSESTQYGIHGGGEHPGILYDWPGAPAEDSYSTETTAVVPQLGFALIGEDLNGKWHHLGSKVSTTIGDVVDGYYRLVRIKDFLNLILSYRNSPYRTLAMLPATVESSALLESNSLTHAAVGLLTSVFNSMQTNEFTAVSGDPTQPWLGEVGYKSVNTCRELQFTKIEYGPCWFQFEDDADMLKGLRPCYGGFYPALKDAS